MGSDNYLLRTLQWLLLLAACAAATALTWWSFSYTSQHRYGGCDGGLCFFGFLLLPLYGVGYLLLLPAFLSVTLVRARWLGGLAVAGVLLSELLAALLIHAAEVTKPAFRLQYCCFGAMAVLLVGWIWRHLAQEARK